MKFLRKFNEHTSYEAELNVGGQDFEIPNVSYCKNVDDVHFNPYNLIEFYVGEITEPQTVSIYTGTTTSIPIQVSKGNKWYTYVLPKDKGLCYIVGDSVKKVVVKADISYEGTSFYPRIKIIPSSTIEASFKGSNTSNVTDMLGMFLSCSGLTSLDLSKWDTSNVTNMQSMFYGCTSLKLLDVSSFKTGNVTGMTRMFQNCSGLTSLDVSNFDTSNVTDMQSMFDGCTSLTHLDLSNFNTSNVINVANMFANCSGLSSLTLSNFDTSKVTNMNHMFDGCTNLISLDISGWDTSKVNSISNMFKGCSNSLKIRMKGCSVETVEKIQNQLTNDGITGDTITTK